MMTDLQQLNRDIAAAEQRRDREFFVALLSEKLLFRRASGAIIGKADFLNGLQGPSPFTDYVAENIEVTEIPGVADRALVTLIVRARKTDSSVQRFRNIRFFTRAATGWELDAWYNYEITSL
ncbi:MAG: nuclear transport factor 2 family protein [Blastocatellia bacterium]